MAKKPAERGLGKGLDALLGDTTLSSQEGGSVTLPVSKVQPGMKQPRKRFDAESLSDLADSIREHGIIQPITVRRLSSGYYQIIAGERRWRAARQAGISEIPALIIEADDRKVMELGLIENLQRENLNPVEEAKGYQTLIQEYNLSQDDVARQIGKSRPTIANAMRLLALPDEVLTQLEEGNLSAGHARALLSLETEEDQIALCSAIIAKKLSVRQTEAEVRRKKEQGREKQPVKVRANDIYYREAEKNLSECLGRKIHISPGKKKGRIELEYYGEDDLEALMETLSGIQGGRA